MSLSRLTREALPSTRIQRILIIRYSSTNSGSNTPRPALRQLCTPQTEQGYFKYDRDWSRDKRYTGQKLGDTPGRMLWRKLGHTYELYPLFVLYGLFLGLLCVTIYISFAKVEVWLDRSNPRPPWDWERTRDNYWKLPTLAIDKKGLSRQRCKIMEQLQDEMLEASKRRHANKQLVSDAPVSPTK